MGVTGMIEDRKVLIKVRAYPCVVYRKINRFVVETSQGLAHINNTGRLEDLIYPKNLAYCVEKRGGKLRQRLIAAKSLDGFALVDTNLQEEGLYRAIELGYISWLRGCKVKKRRPRLGKGFSDLLLDCGEEIIVEIKSADLRGPNGEAMYPDCPTERGRRHLLELRNFNSFVIFVAGFPKAKLFIPYVKGDPKIGEVLLKASDKVKVKSVGMYFDEMTGEVVLYSDSIPVIFYL